MDIAFTGEPESIRNSTGKLSYQWPVHCISKILSQDSSGAICGAFIAFIACIAHNEVHRVQVVDEIIPGLIS